MGAIQTALDTAGSLAKEAAKEAQRKSISDMGSKMKMGGSGADASEKAGEEESAAVRAAAARRKAIRTHVITLTALMVHVSVVAILFSALEGVSFVDGYYSAGQTTTTVSEVPCP